MARLRIIAISIFNFVRYVLSDQYGQGFDFCDRCYRSALVHMYEAMVEEKFALYSSPDSVTDYTRGMWDAYNICIRKLVVILDHIGEHHEC